MEKVFHLIVETSLEGEYSSKVYPHATFEGAQNHLKEETDKLLKTADFIVWRNEVGDFFAETTYSDYIALKIEEIELLP